ncbi:MAG: protein kinase [Acidobacteria bacterium]|nr:protein kinase [Acidobacteriota bacterium]
MAPEQAKGRAANAQSDIWAFGCVLFEMLAGTAAFSGETLVEILGAILRAEPDWTLLPQATPSAIRSLLKRCLQRDAKRRLRDIADARFQIEEALSEPAGPTVAVPARKTYERAWWIAAILTLTAGLGSGVE